jgi:phytoene dehydrogenase-like protein
MEGAHFMSKVIVIGAGIGGMSVAARLAKARHQVEIFEAANFVGGKCRTEWIGRYAFDTGPSLLTLPAVYRDFFLKTGSMMVQTSSSQTSRATKPFRLLRPPLEVKQQHNGITS